MFEVQGIVKKKLLKLLSKIPWLNKSFLFFNNANNVLLRKLLKFSYKMRIPLYGEGVNRLFNDQDITVFYRWPEEGNIAWAEQPSFNIHALLMFEEREVLELCCANGWYYRNFYANISNMSYTGCDFSEEAIDEAKKQAKKMDSNKCTFLVADILSQMPLADRKLTNVFWFASICMFTKEQRKKIFQEIALRLKDKGGILSGSCEIKSNNGIQWEYYVGLFEDEVELRNELILYFKNVLVTRINSRTYYFMASDSKLPFYNG